MMASGLPHPQWNSGDVAAADADLDAARAFYDSLGVAAWGLRVPASVPWQRGRRIGERRLMWLAPGSLRGERADGVSIEAAGGDELEAVLAIDSAAFDADPAFGRGWIAGLLRASDEGPQGAGGGVIDYALARTNGEAVGCAFSVLAGDSVHVAGVAVLEAFRRRGIGGALSSWLLERGFERGAAFAHLSPDDERAASVYRRLGFAEAESFGIWIDVG
jgi:ribosomal protein S18 acetylase RimI-like enzyme